MSQVIVQKLLKNKGKMDFKPQLKTLSLQRKVFAILFVLSLWGTFLFSRIVIDFTEKQEFLYNYKNRTIASGAQIEYNVELDPNRLITAKEYWKKHIDKKNLTVKNI